VIDDVAAKAKYAGAPVRPVRQTLREITALKKLPELIKNRRADTPGQTTDRA